MPVYWVRANERINSLRTVTCLLKLFLNFWCGQSAFEEIIWIQTMPSGYHRLANITKAAETPRQFLMGGPPWDRWLACLFFGELLFFGITLCPRFKDGPNGPKMVQIRVIRAGDIDVFKICLVQTISYRPNFSSRSLSDCRGTTLVYRTDGGSFRSMTPEDTAIGFSPHNPCVLEEI